MQIDLRVMELLASRICHDLISPVSAINNGVELIEEIGESMEDEAMKLIGNSGQQAARRLRLFRLAYGRAGSEENLAVRDVRQVIEQYFSSSKITLTWPEGTPPDDLVSRRGSLKALINLLILGEEILAYGGAMTLSSLDDPQRIGCRIALAGRNAQMPDASRDALAGTTPIEEITARSIQAYVTGKFIAQCELNVDYASPEADRLDITLSFSA